MVLILGSKNLLNSKLLFSDHKMKQFNQLSAEQAQPQPDPIMTNIQEDTFVQQLEGNRDSMMSLELKINYLLKEMKKNLNQNIFEVNQNLV